MKWIDTRHEKILRLTYCIINVAWVELWEWCIKGVQAIVSRELEVHRKHEATYDFRTKKQNSSVFQVHRSLFRKCHMIRYDRSSTAYLPITFRNKRVKVIFKYLYLSMRHGSLICGKAGAFAHIWSKFRCTGTSTLGQQMLRLLQAYPDTDSQYRLDCLYSK